MLHLRLTVPSRDAPRILEALRATAGVAHLAHLPGASTEPGGDLILCDVVREATGALVDWLQEQRVHHEGAITITTVSTVISARADAAEVAAPGYGTDALVWDELEVHARENAMLTPSFVVLMAIAGMIAGVGILLDSPILIIGAMVVGPDYAPVSAVCVFTVRHRWPEARHAVATLVIALGAAALASLVQALLLDLASDRSGPAWIQRGSAGLVHLAPGCPGYVRVPDGRRRRDAVADRGAQRHARRRAGVGHHHPGGRQHRVGRGVRRRRGDAGRGGAAPAQRDGPLAGRCHDA